MAWDDLKYFLAVARSGSLSEAARGLKSSAATTGRHINSLERKLGARLFDHKQTGYVLTTAGNAILRHAEQVEDSVLALEREAFGRDSQITGKVRLATTDDIAALVIIPHLGDFLHSYPGISIEITTRVDVVNLTRREADIAVRAVRPKKGNFLIRRAGRIDFGLYAHKIYAHTRQLRQGTTDLINVEIITWSEPLAHLRGGPWFAKHAPASPVAFAANTPRLHYAACKAGLGVAILPCMAADLDPDLVCLLPPDRVESVDLWLVVHRELSGAARIRAVVEFLHQLGPKFSRQRVLRK